MGWKVGQAHVNYISWAIGPMKRGEVCWAHLATEAWELNIMTSPSKLFKEDWEFFHAKFLFFLSFFLGLTREKHTLTNVQEFCGCDNQWR